MREKLLFALTLLFVSFATPQASFAASQPDAATVAPEVEVAPAHSDSLPTKPVGPLIATRLDKTKIDLSAVPGYKVIYFFSIDCPCVRSCEQESFKPLAAQYAGRVSFFAVASGAWELQDNRANFNALVATHHLSFPVLLDPTHAVADTLKGRTASQAVLLDPQNRIVFNGAADDSKDYRDLTGKIGKTKSYLADAIAEALSGKPVSVPFVQPKGCSIAR